MVEMKKTIRLEKTVEIRKLLVLEWLETNGIGGYASSTVINCHTRKYHGLLVVKLQHPAGKFVFLSNLEDSIQKEQEDFFLTSHKYPGVIYPEGYKNLNEFSANENPTFTYRSGKMQIKKEILLVHKENTVLIKYSGYKKEEKAKLRIKPLLAFRDFHSLSHKNSSLQVRTSPCKKGFFVSLYHGMPILYIQSSRIFQFHACPDWYRNFEYIEEKARGFAFHEDLFIPGVIEFDLKEGEDILLSASLQEQKEDLVRKWNMEISRRRARNRKLKGNSFQKTLQQAADQFIVEDQYGNKSVIAGYPWFLEWGRDAMIALPGLTLYSGREKDCLEILITFAEHEKEGLIPNYIGDTTEKTAYNSADASLWFAWAVQKYLGKTKDYKSVKKFLWLTLKRIFHHYKTGTIFNIKMLENGLLRAGTKDKHMTWMDAPAYGQPVTPLTGWPVEINALWYNLVCLVDELGNQFHDNITKKTETLMDKISLSFNKYFWITEKNYLADIYKEDGSLDTALRPNQIFAVSLPYSTLSGKRAQSVLKIIEQELLTPRGLRTLSPKNKDYHASYEGGSDERDSAYHNGTVWPWLMGHFGEALMKVSPDKKKAAAKLEEFLKKFEDHIKEAGLFSISEIFDANPPHHPRGCISQAWSVAELLRLSLLVEKMKSG